MSKEKNKGIKDTLSNIIDKELPAVMDEIMAAKDIPPDLKANRVGLANTAIHHLKLLRAALG